MRVDAASGQKQLPRERRRQATSLRRRAVLLPCVEAIAEALRLQRVGHCAGCAGHCAGHCDLRICTPQCDIAAEAKVVVFLTPRRRDVVAPTMLDSVWAIGRGTAKVAAARHRQKAAFGGCLRISAHGAFVRAVRWTPLRALRRRRAELCSAVLRAQSSYLGGRQASTAQAAPKLKMWRPTQ